jgi:hypothetical protein
MNITRRLLIQTLSIVFGLLFVATPVEPLHAEEFETPAGFNAHIQSGVSLAFEGASVEYEPGLRLGGTVGYELDLKLPWRTSLNAQVTFAWNRWRFATPLNQGAHSLFVTMVGVAFSHYRPFRIRDVSVWTSMDLGLGDSTVEYDGFIGTNAMTESHSGFAFRFQLGTAYHVLPYLALGLTFDVSNVGLDELTDRNFSATSIDAGLVIRGRFPL